MHQAQLSEEIDENPKNTALRDPQLVFRDLMGLEAQCFPNLLQGACEDVEQDRTLG